MKAQAHVRGFPWKDETPSTEDANKIVAVIEDINNKYHQVLSMPEEVNVLIRATAGVEIGLGPITVEHGAHFDPRDNHIITGVSFSWGEEPRQTPQLSLPVTAHEYGHAIFDHNLTLMDPVFVTIKTLHRDMGVAEQKYKAIIAQYEKALNTTGINFNLCETKQYEWRLKEIYTTEPKRSSYIEFCDELKKIERENARIQKQIFHYEWIVEMVRPYHELFADVVAVLENNDLDAISNSFLIADHQNSTENMDTIRLRSFSQCPSADGFNTTKAHGHFSPTRCEVGRIITSSQLTRPQLLRTIFDVFSEDIMEKIKSTTWDLPSSEDNKRLIKKLRNKFG